MKYTILLHTDAGEMSALPDFVTGNIDVKVGSVPGVDVVALAGVFAEALDSAYEDILLHMDAYDNDEGFFLDLPGGKEMFLPRDVLDVEDIKIHQVQVVTN